jgi:hypothetical protein
MEKLKRRFADYDPDKVDRFIVWLSIAVFAFGVWYVGL